jgi:hypothetical protein
VEDAMKLAGEFPIDIRVYSPHELITMFEGAGWSVSGVYQSLSTKDVFSPESPVYALTAVAV